MLPKISIIVTTYNVEKYIAITLNNIIHQTLKDIEIIVVDDGSSDNTVDIIKEYAAQDPRIKPILMHENSQGGVATAANIGISHATGDYIGFADGDDIYDPSMFEKLYLSAINTDSDLSICKFTDIDSSTLQRIHTYDDGWDELSNLSFLDISQTKNKINILQMNPVPWRKLYKKELLKEKNIRFHECPYFFEDNSFHWMVVLNSSKIAFVPESLCFHRLNRIGQTMQRNNRQLLNIFYQHKVIYDYLVLNSLKDQYENNTIKWILNHIEWLMSCVDFNDSGYFYEVVLVELKKYKANNVKNALKKGSSNLKLIMLINSLLAENKDAFIKVMRGKRSKNPVKKLIYSYQKRGFKGIIKKLNIFSRKDKKQRSNKHTLKELQKKVDNFENIIKVVFAYIEKKQNINKK